MFSTNKNDKKQQLTSAKESWLTTGNTSVIGTKPTSSSANYIGGPKSTWSSSVVAPSSSKSIPSTSSSANKLTQSWGKNDQQMSGQAVKDGKYSASKQSAASSSSWGKQTVEQKFSTSSNGYSSSSKSVESSSSSTNYKSNHKTSVTSSSSRYEDIVLPSSINKNVMDKATNLLTYKSPDRIGLIGRSGLAGSKYLTNTINNTSSANTLSAASYNPVYSRSPAGGYRTLIGTGALATAAALNPALNTPPPGTLPAISIAKLNNETKPSLPSIIENPKSLLLPNQSAISAINNVKSLHNKPTATIEASKATTTSPINNKLYTRLKAKEGYLMIFNQQHFIIPGAETRQGSQMDEEALCRTFYEFGFKPIVKRDLRLKEIEKTAEELRRKDFKKYECVVIVVLSHGNTNHEIYAADGKFDLHKMLVNRVAMNESLRGKAKIFIVSACKGASEVMRMQTDATPISRPIAATNKLPYMRDTLQCFSTYEGFVSYRDPQRGSVFVQELCRVLKEEGESMHIEDVLKHVNIALTERPINQQVPTVTSTMSFNLFFSQLKH